ncbi:MAG: periplasmic divalent cation tolerance protein [Chloroflexia bacterium]|nr:periplasmic divalent cation tolerance protein [Chloroflexia bacterium]
MRLLEARLIACANVYASRSLYKWNGELADEQEMVMLCKTLASSAEAATALIKQLHSYSVPCIIQTVPARSNAEYYQWVRSEVDRVATAEAT